jgi:hypothetical protein
MSDYRIGFYYHHGYGYASDVHWLLTFNGSHFSFRIISADLLPKTKDRQLDYDKKYPVHSLANPVLYKVNNTQPDNPVVEQIVFLKEIPIRAEGELRKEGFEIYAPFVKRQHITNPCLEDFLCICDFTGDLVSESSVFFNGEEVTRQLPKWSERAYQFTKNLIFYNHLVIAGVVVNHICEECGSFEKYSAFLHNPYHNYYYGYDKKPTHDKGISEILKYVDGLDIAAIIDRATAHITNDRSYYRGEVDGYYDTLHVCVSKEDYYLSNDCYLSAHIRGHVLGDNGYHREGPVANEELQRIKFDLFKKYSKEEHVACLVAQWQSYAFHMCYHKHFWDDYFAVIEYALCNYFHLDELTSKHEKFSNKYRQEIDTIYLYANREKNVATINEGIKTSTECNQDKDKFESFLSDFKANIVYAQHALNCHDLKYSYDYPPGVWHNDRLSFNYSIRDTAVWPMNENNPMVR